MPYIIIAIVIAAAGVLFFFMQPASGGNPPKPSTSTSAVQIKENKSRDSIAARLRNLAESSSPAINTVHAMCYAPLMEPIHAEYLCPVCGEKTLYGVKSHLVNTVSYDIPAARRNVSSIKDRDVKVSIDEKSFCKKCSPATTTPRLCMTVSYSGDTLRHTTCGITSDDVLLVSEFLSGKTKHNEGFGVGSPLKNSMPRLKELLGVADSITTR